MATTGAPVEERFYIGNDRGDTLWREGGANSVSRRNPGAANVPHVSFMTCLYTLKGWMPYDNECFLNNPK